ncbi:MAG: 2-hydroxychromene-2-carboxylate isomerase, partial [Lysobacterales bacterium]
MTQPTDAPALPTLDWYFDYLSPFAYFQLERFT